MREGPFALNLCKSSCRLTWLCWVSEGHLCCTDNIFPKLSLFHVHSFGASGGCWPPFMSTWHLQQGVHPSGQGAGTACSSAPPGRGAFLWSHLSR